MGLWLIFTIRELQKVTAYELPAIDNHWVRTFDSIGVNMKYTNDAWIKYQA